MTTKTSTYYFALPKDLVTYDEDILGGQLVLKNTRIPVKLVFEYLANGWATTDLVEPFPEIDVDLVEKLIKYQSEQLAEYENQAQAK